MTFQALPEERFIYDRKNVCHALRGNISQIRLLGLNNYMSEDLVSIVIQIPRQIQLNI